MKLEWELLRCPFPLTERYSLSFGALEAFDTFFIVLRGAGRTGVGEITLLEGYGSEDVSGVFNAAGEFAACLDRGETFRAAVEATRLKAPFTASGIACAEETWRIGLEKAFYAPLDGAIPLAAFCCGDTREQAKRNARRLAGMGYRTLKMKVGRYSPESEAILVRAALEGLPEDCWLRLDANQGLMFSQAVELCERLQDMDDAGRIQFLEQPFGPEAWERHERLAGEVALPIMLDESVWKADDIRRSADCGARFVKLKLCKHLGATATVELIRLARGMGLGVVFGNGVQTVVGNYLEAKIYLQSGLSTAFEGNGFLKPAEGVDGGAVVEGGRLCMTGVRCIEEVLSGAEVIAGRVLPNSVLPAIAN